RNEEGTRLTEDQDSEGSDLTRNDLLSRFYQNRILNQRAGSSITFSHKNNNFTLGGAWQNFDLNGSYRSPDPAIFSGIVDNRFTIWQPYIEYSGNLTRNTWLNIDYSLDAREPTIEQLLPVVDFSNPLFITEGNPGLVPGLNHNAGFWLNHSWPADGIRVHASSRYTWYENQIISDQEVDENLVTRSRPVNYD